MRNKIILKNKKVRFIFKDVSEKKFMKIHKYLTRLEDESSVKKMIKMKKKFDQQDKEEPIPQPEEEYGEQGSPEEYYEE